jgi:hypothetical protein
MPLAKGLTLSVTDASARIARYGIMPDLHFVDIGCASDSLDWFYKKGVTIHSFERRDWDLPPLAPNFPRYADAQLCRPLLPGLIPDYEVYIWVDCDIWLQGHDVVKAYLDAVDAAQNKMILAPEWHYGHAFSRSIKSALTFTYQLYERFYDGHTAEAYCGYPILNSGFFALHRSSSIWAAWLAEIAVVYGRCGTESTSLLHLAEQTALNKILYERQAFLPIDPIYNYTCASSAVLRGRSGKVTVGYPPMPALKAVHLVDFKRYGRQYMHKGLLYDSGDYLSETELNQLRSICA